MICEACTHHDRDDIDMRLAQGSPIATLAPLFGLSHAVLKRHLNDRHTRNVAVRVQNDPVSVLVDLESAERDTKAVIVLAKGVLLPNSETEYLVKPNPKLLLEAIDRVVTIKNTQIKLAKELAMLRKDMVSRETFNKMIDAVTKALESFPEAQAAV